MPRIVAITGASGSIGLAAAKRFLDAGDTVYGLCRRRPEDERVIFLETDLCDPESVTAAFETIRAQSGALDLLISNAGIGVSGAVEFTPEEDFKRIIDVNFLGAVRVIRSALPLLRETRGRIICVSSAAAVFSIPFQTFYSASKAALNMLVLSLRNELKAFGISVCAIMPGDIRTGFTAARIKRHEGDDLYGGVIEKSVSVMERDEQNGMAPEFIGRYLFRVANKKRVRALFTPGAKYKLFAVLGRLLPTSVANTIVGGMYVKK